jgi:hypothetical protein
MKTVDLVVFSSIGHSDSEVKSVLARTGHRELAQTVPAMENFYKVSFVNDEAGAVSFIEALESEGYSYRRIRDRAYSRRELSAFPLLVLTVDAPPRGYGGATYGTEFDLSTACGNCGTGATQISPLLLRRSDLPCRGTIFQTLDREILLSTEVALDLAAANVTGLELREAVDESTREGLGWYQMLATTEMPPFLDESSGVHHSDGCETCSRDGFGRTPGQPAELVYDSAAAPSVTAVCATWEFFGRSVLRTPLPESTLARPLALVEPRVAEMLYRKRVRAARLYPVRIKEV